MIFDVDVQLHYTLPHPIDLLLQIEVADLADQRVTDPSLELNTAQHFSRVAAEDGIGTRIWVHMEHELRCQYRARVTVDRAVPDLAQLHAVPPHLLPGETVKYLMPSRYCPTDEFQTFVAAEFGTLSGGPLIAAMRDWIADKIAYRMGASGNHTTALDTFVQREGVCRDFAHLMVTFARAAAIPARFASVYAPGVTPQDFHAVAEVYLDGAWHLVDPTDMAPADTIARIGVGADAAETSFLSGFGRFDFARQEVRTTPVTG